MNLLPLKQPHEEYVHSLDFQNLTGTDPVTYANSRVTLLKGTIDDTADIVQQSLTSDGAVNLTIRRGTADQDYSIRVLISTSTSNVFEEDLVLRIREVL